MLVFLIYSTLKLKHCPITKFLSSKLMFGQIIVCVALAIILSIFADVTVTTVILSSSRV